MHPVVGLRRAIVVVPCCTTFHICTHHVDPIVGDASILIIVCRSSQAWNRKPISPLTYSFAITQLKTLCFSSMLLQISSIKPTTRSPRQYTWGSRALSGMPTELCANNYKPLHRQTTSIEELTRRMVHGNPLDAHNYGTVVAECGSKDLGSGRGTDYHSLRN